MARAPTTGQPGTVYSNDTGKVKYQYLCNWSNSCGLCCSLDHAIDVTPWPIPLHRGCRCSQISIFPGRDAQPYVDFRDKIDSLSDAQRARVLGSSALKLVESGAVKWSDVVSGTQIRTLAEVVARKKLSIEDMVQAGVRRDVAEQAVGTSGLSAREAAAARAQQIAERLARAAAARAQLVARDEAVAAARAGARVIRKRVVTRGGAIVARRADYLKSAGVQADIADEIAERAPIEAQLGVEFTPGPGARDRRRYRTVLVDVTKVDADLARERSMYVGPGGTGAAIGDRYREFGTFLDKARAEGIAIEMPRLTIADATGNATIADGRHRFAYLRDAGARVLPVSVPKGEAAEFARRYGPRDESGAAVQAGSAGGLFDRLRDAVRGVDLPWRQDRAITSLLGEVAGPSVPVRAHGMPASEPMRSVELGGLTLYFPDPGPFNPSRTPAVVATLRQLADVPQIPPALARHTKAVYFSGQANADDSAWKAVHGNPDFVSLATGGDEMVVVYSGQALSPGALVHEMGHNLASATWRGSLTPPPKSAFAQATAAGEPPVSDYGATNLDEDFAEAVRLYWADPDRMKQVAPLRYAVLREMIGGETDG